MRHSPEVTAQLALRESAGACSWDTEDQHFYVMVPRGASSVASVFVLAASRARLREAERLAHVVREREVPRDLSDGDRRPC